MREKGRMKDKMTIILFSGELDRRRCVSRWRRPLPASQHGGTIFFTFWGLNILKKEHLALSSSQKLMQKMFIS